MTDFKTPSKILDICGIHIKTNNAEAVNKLTLLCLDDIFGAKLK